MSAISKVTDTVKSKVKQLNAGRGKEVAAAEWDYVIVGGGSAGCAMANRLSYLFFPILTHVLMLIQMNGQLTACDLMVK